MFGCAFRKANLLLEYFDAALLFSGKGLLA
jgi:hypothetical protein